MSFCNLFLLLAFGLATFDQAKALPIVRGVIEFSGGGPNTGGSCMSHPMQSDFSGTIGVDCRGPDASGSLSAGYFYDQGLLAIVGTASEVNGDNSVEPLNLRARISVFVVTTAKIQGPVGYGTADFAVSRINSGIVSGLSILMLGQECSEGCVGVPIQFNKEFVVRFSASASFRGATHDSGSLYVSPLIAINIRDGAGSQLSESYLILDTPEPSTYCLFAIGLGVLAAGRHAGHASTINRPGP